MTNILIVAGGNFPENINISKLSEKNEIIIAVDKGYELLFNNNIKPDYLLGDFDSISKNLKIDSNINKIKSKIMDMLATDALRYWHRNQALQQPHLQRRYRSLRGHLR